MPSLSPYGCWKSPITAGLLVGDSLGLGQVAFDGADIYWNELRPLEGGRNVIVCSRAGRMHDLLPAPFSARTRVNEYGGGAFAVGDGVLYFSNDGDHRVYRTSAHEAPRPIVPAGTRHYADFVLDRTHRRLLAVCEEHSADAVRQMLVALDIDGAREPRTLTAGADFFAAPRLAPDGKRVAWLSWRHPDMPWDGTELWLADVAGDSAFVHARRVAGGREESILQPAFAPDGELYFVSDRDDWWNLYRLRAGTVQRVAPLDAEIGWPHWIFGDSTYAFLSSRQMLLGANRGGLWQLYLLDLAHDRLQILPSPCTEFHSLVGTEGQAAFVGASGTTASAVLRYDAASGEFETLRRATTATPSIDYLASPQSVSFPTAHGAQAHGFFYAPRNRDHAAPAGERPPLLVLSHGGPTACASPALNLKIQYWTSRGFAVLDVNYRGSTGFGRRYRRALDGTWGVADVEDCVHGAQYAVAQGWVDGARLAIRGGSAGGLTTLCALAFHTVFRAGAVYYGVSDLEALARDTHNFERYYLERLIGPYPAQRELYRARSPIHHAARIACPVIFFQGLDDKVVPPAQTAEMVQALRNRRVPVACIEFAGEAHGFRRAENIKRALEAELYFYGRSFGFVPADVIDPVTFAI